MRRHHSIRPAFTLTEMMVATALILFIMVIISTAFRSGLDTFSKLNTTGKLQEQLVNAQRIIQRDLAADHFDGITADGFHGPRLSDQRLDRVGWTPPTLGYFIAWQNSPSKTEQSSIMDGESITSSRSDGGQAFLRFTVKLRTDTPPYDIPMYRFGDAFQAQAQDRTTYPDSILDPNDSPFASRKFFVTSTWAQVQYWLTQNQSPNDVTTMGSTPLPLFSLRRSIDRLGNSPPPSAMPNLTMPSSSGAPTSSRITRAWDPRDPNATLPAANNPFPPPSSVGDDILLTNVISFEVKYLWSGPADYGGLVKQPVSPYPNSQIRALSPLTNSSVIDIVDDTNPANPIPTADWPYTDLPLDSSRTTKPNDGVTRVPQTKIAWPGGGSRQWDEDSAYYFDTWFNPSSFVPDWAALAPVDDRFVSGAINPNATLPNQPPLRIRIKAIQFKIRIWDDKTGQTRQITIMQEV